MRIWIISSGNDTLALFKMLAKYDHSYIIYHDQKNFPFGTKDFDFILQEIEKGIQFLQDKGVETIILDPIYELYFSKYHLHNDQILPLFSTYLQEYVFPFSLVGKLGILTDFWSKDLAQELVNYQAQSHQLTEHQQAIKKFHFPFCYRVKSAKPWVLLIQDLWVHNPFLIKTMKNDLRFFKDANVDTFIPLHYRMFEMQRSIKACFNAHKTRFHDFSFLEQSFCHLIEGIKKEEKSDYSLEIYSNQSMSFLLQETKLRRMMTRGWKVPYHFENLSAL